MYIKLQLLIRIGQFQYIEILTWQLRAKLEFCVYIDIGQSVIVLFKNALKIMHCMVFFFFSFFSQKSAFKDASVCLFIFDCLQFNDENLMKK